MSEVSYFDYQPTSTSRVRENVEWSITYTYNARDTENPRVLLIGDNSYFSGNLFMMGGE